MTRNLIRISCIFYIAKCFCFYAPYISSSAFLRIIHTENNALNRWSRSFRPLPSRDRPRSYDRKLLNCLIILCRTSKNVGNFLVIIEHPHIDNFSQLLINTDSIYSVTSGPPRETHTCMLILLISGKTRMIHPHISLGLNRFSIWGLFGLELNNSVEKAKTKLTSQDFKNMHVDAHCTVITQQTLFCLISHKKSNGLNILLSIHRRSIIIIVRKIFFSCCHVDMLSYFYYNRILINY